MPNQRIRGLNIEIRKKWIRRKARSHLRVAEQIMEYVPTERDNWLRGVKELAGAGREIFRGVDPNRYVTSCARAGLRIRPYEDVDSCANWSLPPPLLNSHGSVPRLCRHRRPSKIR